jgi:prepilin-type N-terminal cleavage/methylation domain-containing protein
MLLKTSLKDEIGLTLIELLATIVILSIIAAIAVPSLFSAIQNQRDSAVIHDVVNFYETGRIAYTSSSCGDNDICEFNSGDTNELSFKTTKFTEGIVDFTNGTSLNKIIIKVDILPDIFKGRNAQTYKQLFEDSDGFTVEALFNAIE